jgi:PadR family transcriptional regulator, regulatory protein PadR
MLGEFEYFVIAACQQLGEDAYGASIATLIEKSTGRNCSTGALYLTLDRLEAKGLIETHLGEPTPERGGRAKRMVTITGEGRRAASEFHRAITKISRGIRWEASTNAIRN